MHPRTRTRRWVSSSRALIFWKSEPALISCPICHQRTKKGWSGVRVTCQTSGLKTEVPMALANYTRQFRPLRPGVQIINRTVNEPGTLGCFAADAAGQLHLISCYHVLCGLRRSPLPLDETVCQPYSSHDAVGTVSRGDPALDIAA